MSTVLKLGPTDHGRPMSLDEFLGSEYQEGYHYEIIHGKLYVSPLPNAPENHVEDWVLEKLKAYARERPDVLNFVTNKARCFVPGSTGVTAPEPDMAAYQGYPLDRRFEVRWQDVSPILVVEVLSHEDPDKDLERNPELYFQVPSILEYWLFDNRACASRPRLLRHRRRGLKWQVKKLAAGATYTTKLLPGFELVLDPLR